MTTPVKFSGARSPQIVFVVDDDPAIRRLLLLHLESAGFNAQGFNSGEALLITVTPQSNGCLVLDIDLPGISGTELQTELSHRGVQRPIIFLSGIADLPITASVMNRGAADLIGQSLDISDRTVEIHKSRAMSKMQSDNLASFVLRWTGVKESKSRKEKE